MNKTYEKLFTTTLTVIGTIQNVGIISQTFFFLQVLLLIKYLYYFHSRFLKHFEKEIY